MTIKTWPIFYYDYTIGVNNTYINFNEGGLELTATVTSGRYSFQELASVIALSLTEVGGQEYSVAVDRDERTYTISAPSTFSLLFASGANAGGSAASVLGFSDIDYVGASSYIGGSSGSAYEPRFSLQNYIALEDYQEYGSASVNESASGKVEVYSTGARQFTEFNITYVTDKVMRDGSLFITDGQSLSKLRAFLIYCITKGPVEMMIDKDNRSSYDTLILESTPTSSTGTGFKLKEMYSRGLIGFFETGKLKFRKRT